MSDHFTLHGHWLSQPSGKVGLMLRMSEVAHAYRHVDLLTGEQKSPEFLKLNRFGQVPVLVHDGMPIVESGVILVYLAVKLGTFDGASPEERLRVREWMSWEADTLFWIARRRAQIRFLDGSDEIIELYGKAARRALSFFDTHIADHAYVVGDVPTIVDIASFVTIAFADEAKLDIADWPNITAWQARMRALPHCTHPYDFMPKESRE